jgi:hypothetical protein
MGNRNTHKVCAPREHVPEVERKIRTVKERIRGLITMLPFRKIPTIMVTHAVIFSVMWLNIQGVETEGVQGNSIYEGGEIQGDIEEDHQLAMGEWSDQEGDILDREDSEDSDEAQS